MEATQEAVAILSLAARKGLIAQESAILIKKDLESGVIQAGAKPVADILVQQGHITATQADLLLSDFAKAQGPKVIGGHQLIAKIGQGGMGAVFKATQLSMQREVAIKLLAPHLARDKEFVERFVREARAAGKVQHPNVIGCYDVGVDHGTPYMSLEFVAGGDALQKCKAAGGRLSEREALTIIRDGARGLGAIHKAGMIHRDIKPANIFLTEDGVAKIADLGLARSSAGDDKMTQTGATVGSPAYMSPEQAKGAHDLDIRTDIYSLGATLYHMVCGEPPFTASTVFATVAKVINDPVPDARARNPSLSPSCSALIKKCMVKDRAQRFQTPEELLEACEALLSGSVITNIASPRSDRHRAAAAGGVPRAHHHHDRPAATKPMGLYIGGAVAALVVVVVAIAAMSGGKPQPTQPTQPPAVAAAPTVTPPPSRPTPPTVTTASVAASPAPVAPAADRPGERLREFVRDRAADRQATPAPTVPAPTPTVVASPAPVSVAPAVPAPAPAEAIPSWSAAGIATLDQVLAGDLVAAAKTARDLPREYRDAVDAVAKGRGELAKTWAAHSAAIIAAKPELAELPKGFLVVAVTEKNLMVRDPKGGAEMGYTWQRLKNPDLAILRAIVETDNPSAVDRQRFAYLDIVDTTTLAAADASDPAIANLQKLGAVKEQVAAEAARVAEAERQAKEAAARLAAASAIADERTRRILRHITEVTTFDPEIIDRPITSDIELRDFVIISKRATLAGGRLIPTAGALVINLAENVGYQPQQIRGMPFISMSGHPAHMTMGGRIDAGTTFSNAIFFGNVLVDGFTGDFHACSFIGSALPLPFPMNEVFNVTGNVRPGQFQNSDFLRMRMNDQLAMAATDKCFFRAVEVKTGGRPAHGEVNVCAWDPDASMQQHLNQLQAGGLPLVRLHPQAGRPATLLGPDGMAIGDALDRVFLQWADRLKRWSE